MLGTPISSCLRIERVSLPRIQVLGRGSEDVFNWDEPSHSWGLFVFACPGQQGAGANCYNSLTPPGPVAVPIIVRQKDDRAIVVLSLTATRAR